MSTPKYDNNDLILLIQKWQKNPKEFTNLLVDNIFPTLEKICNKMSNDSLVHNLNDQASTLINDVYIKILHNSSKHELDGIELFYFTLRDVVRSILLDSYQKRKTASLSALSHSLDFDTIMPKTSASEYHIEDVDNALTTLLDIDPNASIALSLKFYTASSISHIAAIMNKPTDKVEQYLIGGSKILTSLIKKPDSLSGYTA
jgi:DNA-directed RNA polymerase specialized sigma24 family protein